jgi:hypothetical protein
MKRNLSTTSSMRNSVSPTSSTFTHRIIVLLTLDPQDVVGVDRAVHERLSGAHPLALLDADVRAPG